MQSRLGEPLRATVAISQGDAKLDVSCFAVTTDLAIKKSNLVLRELSEGNYTLNVVGHAVINEPVLNMHVAYQCDPSFSRHYVLLIDPPQTDLPSIESPTVAIPPAQEVRTKAKSTTKRPHATATEDESASVTVEPPSTQKNATAQHTQKKKKAKAQTRPTQSTSVENTLDARLEAAYTGSVKEATPSLPTPQTPPAESATKQESHPVLILSGGGGDGINTMSLRLETQLDVNRPPPSEDALSDNIEAEDEVTVMANRLENLESQILSLQKRNAELQATAKQAQQPKADGLVTWLKYIGFAIGVLSVAAFIEWLRRLYMRKKMNQAAVHWFDENKTTREDGEAEVKPTLTTTQNMSVVTPAESGTWMHGAAEPSTASGNAQADELDLEDENEDDVHNVIEHAEVFIEHGRAPLAMQLLKNHVEEHPAQSPEVWLKLLSVIAQEGSEDEYQETLAKCGKHFNVKMPNFQEARQADTSSIEDHPNIVSKIEGAWGSQYVLNVLDELIFNKRLQPRDGFHRGTFEDLFFLKYIAKFLRKSKSADYEDKIVRIQDRSSNTSAPEAQTKAVESQYNIFNTVRADQYEIDMVYEHEEAETAPSASQKSTESAIEEFKSVAPEEVPAQPPLMDSALFDIEATKAGPVPTLDFGGGDPNSEPSTSPSSASPKRDIPQDNAIEWGLPELTTLEQDHPKKPENTK